MRYHEFITEKANPVGLADIINAMKPIANQKVVWRGMSAKGQTAYSKINNERSGFYGGISDQASDVMKGLKVMNPAFGAYSQSKAEFFGSLNAMIPIQPYRAMQSDKLEDLVYKSDLDSKDLVDSYSERMDLEDSEIVFDIKEYYLLSISFALQMLWDPDDFSGGKLRPKIKETIKGIKTYQDIIDIFTDKSD